MKLQQMFEAKRKSGNRKPLFMPYVCCGDPSADFTVKLVKTLVENGADAIEFGIPFSDPIADGKTIQAASSRALKNGMTPKKAIGVISELRKSGIGVPIIAMTYYNIIYAMGAGDFLKSIKEAGADALIVPDVPLEESDALHERCLECGIDLVFLITPNCSDERIRKIAEKASGFLYAVAVLGITGERKEVAPEAISLVERAKKLTGLPIAVGFGISKPEHVHRLASAGADGVIVGSGLVSIYSKYLGEKHFDERKALEAVSEFGRLMKS